MNTGFDYGLHIIGLEHGVYGVGFEIRKGLPWVLIQGLG